MRHVSARATDPETSHLAAEHIHSSGKSEVQRIEVLRLVREHPGRTSLELAQYGTLDRYQIARRIPELRKASNVRATGPRRCTVGGRAALTWEATA